jgi:hypothetical protein
MRRGALGGGGGGREGEGRDVERASGDEMEVGSQEVEEHGQAGAMQCSMFG